MAGDFDAVYGLHGRTVHAYLARLTGDPWLADELCQETFVRFLRHRRRIQGGNGALRPWLLRVATNLARDRARRPAHQRLTSEPPTEQADTVAAQDLDDRVRREVEALPADLRAAFLLRAHHELSFGQVAAVLEVCERTAKERFRRAREILAHRLAPLVDEDFR